MNTAHLENVRVQNLKRRVKAFRDLYGLTEEQVVVKVSGFFAGRGYELASLQRFHIVDLKASGRVWLLVQDVDGESVQLRPEDDTICDVKIEEVEARDVVMEEEDEDGDVVCCYCAEAVERADAWLVGVGVQGEDLYWCGCSGSNKDTEEPAFEDESVDVLDEADRQESDLRDGPSYLESHSPHILEIGSY